jgi:hypothetical protein
MISTIITAVTWALILVTLALVILQRHALKTRQNMSEHWLALFRSLYNAPKLQLTEEGEWLNVEGLSIITVGPYHLLIANDVVTLLEAVKRDPNFAEPARRIVLQAVGTVMNPEGGTS